MSNDERAKKISLTPKEQEAFDAFDAMMEATFEEDIAKVGDDEEGLSGLASVAVAGTNSEEGVEMRSVSSMKARVRSHASIARYDRFMRVAGVAGVLLMCATLMWKGLDGGGGPPAPLTASAPLQQLSDGESLFAIVVGQGPEASEPLQQLTWTDPSGREVKYLFDRGAAEVERRAAFSKRAEGGRISLTYQLRRKAPGGELLPIFWKPWLPETSSRNHKLSSKAVHAAMRDGLAGEPVDHELVRGLWCHIPPKWKGKERVSSVDIATVERTPSHLGENALTVHLKRGSVPAMAQISKESVGERLAIIARGYIVTAPKVMTQFASPFQITTGSGGFSTGEIDDMVRFFGAPESKGPTAGDMAAEARQRLMLLKRAAQLFLLKEGRLPRESEYPKFLYDGSKRRSDPYVEQKNVHIDPWGRPFEYLKHSGRHFEFRTLGRDGKPGGVLEDRDLSTARRDK